MDEHKAITQIFDSALGPIEKIVLLAMFTWSDHALLEIICPASPKKIMQMTTLEIEQFELAVRKLENAGIIQRLGYQIDLCKLPNTIVNDSE